jgi:hypothetical protein
MPCEQRHRRRVILFPSLLALCLAATPATAHPQSALDAESLRAAIRTDGQTFMPVSAQTLATPQATRRDSLKNGLIIGGAIAGAMAILGTKLADCPDARDTCPGAKALGIAGTVAAGAALGGAIDLLIDVRPAPAPFTPTPMRRNVVVGGRVRW